MGQLVAGVLLDFCVDIFFFGKYSLPDAFVCCFQQMGRLDAESVTFPELLFPTAGIFPKCIKPVLHQRRVYGQYNFP